MESRDPAAPQRAAGPAHRARGFFNSYNAENPLFRFPLNHFFHSNDFRLTDLRRLDHVGSDHSMYLALRYDPAREQE